MTFGPTSSNIEENFALKITLLGGIGESLQSPQRKAMEEGQKNIVKFDFSLALKDPKWRGNEEKCEMISL